MTHYRLSRAAKFRWSNHAAKCRRRQGKGNRKRWYVFGIFTPAKNWFVRVREGREEMVQWVDVIGGEIRRGRDVEDDYNDNHHQNGDKNEGGDGDGRRTDAISTSLDITTTTTTNGIVSNSSVSYSGAASFSDDSIHFQHPSTSNQIHIHNHNINHHHSKSNPSPSPPLPFLLSPTHHPERIIHSGNLYLLHRSHTHFHFGRRRFKRLWLVLRPHSIAMYKDAREYQVLEIIEMKDVVGAAEIEPLSRSWGWCLQVITRKRTWRFAAGSEEERERWVGGVMKMILSR
ncbi:PH domain-containing protein [Ascosphaera apis ARSEF 7405]|uniref:PH domain-containing protein n=1 Tax=Ascosphaera apis ARSEF 7405 TaxID=392613 RepID=A0A167V8H9_9EURO|nr:PH domain-containing protein [Ascosphaera apis ARSEF 7405]